jgi:uncharacterized protein YndB with AHSA1/START domain
MKTIIHVSELAATPAAVFQALTTLPGLSSWWTTKVEGDAGPAGQIAFTFDGDFNPTMLVTRFDAPSVLEWRCVAGVEQWRENTFRFSLEAQGTSTRLRFRQDYASELSDDDYGAYNYNWGYYLESLRQYVETGSGRPYPTSATARQRR